MIKAIPKHIGKKITLGKVKAFYQGTKRKLEFSKLPEYVQDQFYYRITKMDKTCIANGMCPCTCPFPAKQLSDEPCEKNCYPWIMEKNIWEEYCKVMNIDITFVRAEALKLLKDDYYSVN